MAESRFVVGIDLGTTNSVLAWVDTALGDQAAVQVLAVPQLVKAGEVAGRERLPSFMYLPAEGELPAAARALPWGTAEHVVGELARARGAEVPGRVVTSAKSWLCTADADASGAILPWGAPPDVPRVSPVDASAAYLAHLRAAWDAAMPAPLATQEIYLAVPASFDPAARELTARAAERAGLRSVHLLEEPQAAFYAWLAAAEDGWRRAVHVGDVILVCDVGGGTTDLSLVAVGEEHGELVLERKAVGDHILLGGDNMDLALAHAVRARLAADKTTLDEWQLRGLVHACREAKEKLLAEGTRREREPVVVLGRSKRVVGGAVRTELARADLEAVLFDGFFPAAGPDTQPRTSRRAALREIGLPYAEDPAVTHHVTAFLTRHRDTAPRGVSAVLFNGGVMKATALRERVVAMLSGWPGAGAVRVLTGAHPDLAVAEGAATYGLARRGRGVRIRGGTARAFYVGVETATPAVPGLAAPVKALCLAPFGMEEGSEVDLPGAEFGLVVGAPAEFRFFGSSTRRTDQPGAVVEGGEVGELDELAPIEVTLDAAGEEGRTVPVRLRSQVTDVGTLALWGVARDGRRWKVEFNVRQAD